jgi:hypothetical protein
MNKHGFNQYKEAKNYSPAFIIGSLALCFASTLAVWYAWRAFASDIMSFRSCASNNSNLVSDVVSCGKHGVNIGDLILFGLFVATGLLCFGMWTHVVRMVRKDK